ncbi:MAG TPA: hypothetical protein VM492_05910 [Sumerlaeia bacterium]|nr:hypothetical protein [Sumerlaeia bacterium]
MLAGFTAYATSCSRFRKRREPCHPSTASGAHKLKERTVLDEAAPNYDGLIEEMGKQAAKAEQQMKNVTDWQIP